MKSFLIIFLFGLPFVNGVISFGFFSRICGFGRTGSNGIFNGEFYGNETDPTNNNKTIWYSSDITEDIAIEWGVKYLGSSFEIYIFKQRDAGGIYGYCGISNVEPTDCDSNWFFFNGTDELIISTIDVLLMTSLILSSVILQKYF